MVSDFTWSSLVTYLETHHRAVETFPGDRLRFTYSHEGSDVPVGAYLLRSPAGQPWLGISMKLGPVDQLRTRSALVANADLPIGALSIIAEFAALRQTLPLSGMTATHLEQTVRALAITTLQLRAVASANDVDLDTPYAYIFR